MTTKTNFSFTSVSVSIFFERDGVEDGGRDGIKTFFFTFSLNYQKKKIIKIFDKKCSSNVVARQTLAKTEFSSSSLLFLFLLFLLGGERLNFFFFLDLITLVFVSVAHRQ
jgi:hypothetical protein